MDVVAFTRQLVDIESITGNEAHVGDVVQSELIRLGYQANKLPVEGNRYNVYATSPQQPKPSIVFSTHMDTVPPFIPSSEDADRIYGRGSCDAKGIIAAQIAASERLRQENMHRWRIDNLRAASFWSMASLRKTEWRRRQRARCE
jgi:acetylornithine deacetylase